MVVVRSAVLCGLLTLALTACGSSGDAVRREAVVPGGPAVQPGAQAARAVEQYRAYATKRVDDTIARTGDFVAALKKGELRRAKALYAPSRLGWESIEPVAEAFSDVDVKVDAREADLGEGQRWTGWHRLEKALWRRPRTVGKEAGYGDLLLRDLDTLKSRLPRAEITVVSMAEGAKELLDEVATSKVTGEEEAFSHTDLWDFKGNVDGAFKVHRLLRPIVWERNPKLVARLDSTFAAMRKTLAGHAHDGVFVSYTDLSKAQVKELSDALNALAEPLSALSAAVAV
ncbi:hypothetical protein GCM10017673_05250 [Streptosporangium violaceochromogenes]|nr:hypothetical protein GCM10017673_05250 [Streptosporangium violaceochromogenes]